MIRRTFICAWLAALIATAARADDETDLPVWPAEELPASDRIFASEGFVTPAQFSGSPLDRQIADLSQRLLALESPPLSYPSIAVHGVFQVDGVLFSQDEANRATFGDIQDGADFRRARLSANGALAVNMNYFFQMDFAFPGRPTFTDVWLEWTDVPVLGTLRVGQWKHPFSLEVVSSFRYTTFMERSLLFIPFTPFRHIGIGAYDHSEDLMTTWAVSLIRTGQDQFGGSISDDGGNGVVGRLTHLLWYDDTSSGRGYFHVGGGYYLNAPPNDVVRFRTIPEIFAGEQAPGGVGTSGQAVPGVLNGTPFFVDTGPIVGVDLVHTFGLEALLVAGPFSLQSEGMTALVDCASTPTAALSGAYVQAGWFLTGEHRPYNRAAGAIDRVIPYEDFFLVSTASGVERGSGAWEFALRWSYIDLTDGDIVGGDMHDLTAGLNWYCNPYCKVVFNYIHSWVNARTGVASQADAFGLRAQIDF